MKRLKSWLLCGSLVVAAPILAADLGKYREIQFGSDLATVVRQTGMTPLQVKVIQHRPGLIQELQWRPQLSNSSSSAKQTDPVQEVILGFLDGKLYRIAVNYDRYETEGLTAADIIGTLSTTYGTPLAAPAAGKVAPAPVDYYGDQENVIARWEDAEHRFELVRGSYGPVFKLVGTLKRLEEPVKAAVSGAALLDKQEGPWREAAENALRVEAERAKLEKSRQANKPNFRP